MDSNPFPSEDFPQPYHNYQDLIHFLTERVSHQLKLAAENHPTFLPYVQPPCVHKNVYLEQLKRIALVSFLSLKLEVYRYN